MIESSLVSKWKGEDVKLERVKTEQIKYVRKTLSQDTTNQKHAGMSDIDILKLHNGCIPDRGQVYHKFSLDDKEQIIKEGNYVERRNREDKK